MAIEKIGFLTRLNSFLGKLFGFAFKIKLLYIFMLFIVINATVISVQQRDINVGISDLGRRFLNPTLEVQEISLSVIENGGIYKEDVNSFKSIGLFLWDVWEILTQLYIILMWLSVIARFITIFPLDESKSVLSIFIAIPIFLVVQMIYIASTKQGDFFQPWIAFKDFLRALPYYVQPIKNIGENLRGGATGAKITGVIHP